MIPTAPAEPPSGSGDDRSPADPGEGTTAPTGTAAPSLRDLFVAAALDLLDAPDTSLDLRKVAERAGKSRTAPYLAFGKADEGGGLPALQLAVAAEGFLELADRMDEVNEAAGDPEENLQEVATAYLAFARDRPRLFRLMFGTEVSAAMASPSSAPEAAREQRGLAAARRRLEAIFQRVLEGQEPGYVKGLEVTDKDTAAGAIWAMVHGVAVLTIDGQWGMGQLGAHREDPQATAAGALRFLTTASIHSLKGARTALELALETRGLSDVLDGPGPRLVLEEPRRHGAVALDPEVGRISSAPLEEALSPAEPGVSGDGGRSALRRAREVLPRLEGIRVLWIDDHPEWVAHERVMLEGLGVEVIPVPDTGAALEVLEEEGVDLAISDIRRGTDDRAGIRALPALRTRLGRAPVLFYVQRLREDLGTPTGAFGITNDPQELLHLVLDVVERGWGREDRQ